MSHRMTPPPSSRLPASASMPWASGRQGRRDAGTWSALRHAWQALRRRRTPMRLVVDGRRLRTAAPAVTICNGPYHGMGFAVAPDADPADGLLDVVVFSGMSRFDVIRHFLAVARGRPRREPGVRYLPPGTSGSMAPDRCRSTPTGNRWAPHQSRSRCVRPRYGFSRQAANSQAANSTGKSRGRAFGPASRSVLGSRSLREDLGDPVLRTRGNG